MKKIDSLNQVAEFHTTFDSPILTNPEIPSDDRAALRVKLLQEELDELKEAIEKKNLVEVADALCDLQYVLSGAVLEFGLGDVFVSLFNEVHRSNMSKACLSEEEAEKTIKHYKEKGEDAYAKKSGEKFNVYRISDKKILKSIDYSPADLKSILSSSQK
ncbi:MAG: hypothetical protein FDW93_02100 [Bergeyella sp.]|nr:hypothetical protein [Bergeyella sp.]